MPRAEPDQRLRPWRRIWPVYLAAPVVLTGIQVLLPALPELQARLGLGDSEIALVTSLYLLPSAVAAVPAGFLADHFGRREVLTAGLVVFGLGGLYITMNPDAFIPMLVVRAVQGAASATVLSLTITIIGDVVAGPQQVTAQAYRGIALKVGDGFWPLVGGLLVGLAWWAPFAAQLITLPVAVITWFGLSDIPNPTLSGQRSQRERISELGSTLSDLSILTLHASGFLRFFFKLALLTYLPVLAVSRGTASAAAVGMVLAASAVAAMASSPATGWLVVRVAPSRLLAVCLSVIALSMAAIAVDARLSVTAFAAITFGLADGVYGVVINATTTQVIPARIRATFVGVSTSVRNLGKFTAPTLIGVLVLFLSLQTAFVIVGAVAGAAISTAWPLRAFDGVIRGAPDTAAAAADV